MISDPKPLLSFEALAPSPSQVYYQVLLIPFMPVKPNQQQPGRLILRDWPRKRQSQNWSRNGALNPGERVVTFEEFINGDIDSIVQTVFGNDKFEELRRLTKIEIKRVKNFT